MARRKSRKNADASRRPAVVNEQEAAAPLHGGADKIPKGEAPAAPAPKGGKAGRPGGAPASAPISRPTSGAPSAPASAPASGKWVRLSTCIAGMVLTLVLGLYLGTLLPGVLQDMRGQAGLRREMAAAPAQMPPGDAVPSAPAAPASPSAESARPHPGATDAAAAGLPPGLAARLSELEAAVRKDPASAANWTELGNLFFDAGRVHEAINAYERSLAIAPGNADVLTDLGIMYRENDAPEKAVDCFRKAFAADPRHENALFNAGVVLYNDLGRKDEAVAAWRRLLALNPQARAPDGRTVQEMVRRLEEPPRR